MRPYGRGFSGSGVSGGATSSQVGILFELTGDRELRAKLLTLDRQMQSKIGRRAVNAGLNVILQAQKRAAPTPALRKSLGKSNKKNKSSRLIEGKAGVNVGKKPAKLVDGSVVSRGRQFPQAHLLVLGTRERYTKSKGVAASIKRLSGGRTGFRGKIIGRRFIENATMGAANEASQVAAAVAWDGIRKIAGPELKAT